MSARRDGRDWGGLEPDVRAPHDPHDIIPDDFPYPSIEAARQAVEGFGAHIDDPRCQACDSPNLAYKPGSTAADCEHKRAEPWRCESCGAHMSEPQPSPDDAAAGEQTNWGEWR